MGAPVLGAKGKQLFNRLNPESLLKTPGAENLLPREGYEDLAAVQREGREEGLAESILTLLQGRGISVSRDVEARITACRDTTALKTWLLAAARVDNAEEIFD